MVVLVVGADEAVVAEATGRAGEDGDVIVLDPSPERLERLERSVRDPRVWFLIGDGAVMPLPDRSVDAALGGKTSPEIERVLRSGA